MVPLVAGSTENLVASGHFSLARITLENEVIKHNSKTSV